MKKRSRVGAFTAALLAGAVCATLALAACGSKTSQSPTASHAVADLVILDRAVATVNTAQPEARALAVKDGKIAFVGDDAGAQKWIGPQTKVVQAKGMSVWPGLIDSHIHLMEGAL